MPITLTGDKDDNPIHSLLQTLLRKELIERPPEYSAGDDIFAHISKMDDFYKAINVTDDTTKVAMLFRSLCERVQKEIKCLPDYEAGCDYNWIVNALKDLFKEKKSSISPILKLLQIKQKDCQSLRDYISELRIEAFTVMRDYSPDEREAMMVSAFINGLHNTDLTIALRLKKPSTLEEAYDLVKKDVSIPKNLVESNLRKIETDNYNNVTESNVITEILSLKTEVLSLKNQFTSLISILGKQLPNTNTFKQNINNRDFVNKGRNNYRPVYDRPLHNNVFKYQPNRGKPNHRLPAIKCYNCQKEGHIARYCREGRTSNYRKIDNVSNVSSENMSVNSDHDFFLTKNTDSHPTGTHLGAVEPTIPFDYNKKEEVDAFLIHTQKNFGFKYINIYANDKTNSINHETQKRTKNSKKKHNKTLKSPKLLQSKADYDVNFKQFKATPTLISKSHSEKAANKPVIRGKVQNLRGKIFCDSGAEINFIDLKTVKLIQTSNPSCVIIHKKYNIKCANGSKMENQGVIKLELNLAGHRSIQEFAIIENLFPRVILGMRTMKDIGLNICPYKNGVEIRNKFIPFLSKVQEIDHMSPVN